MKMCLFELGMIYFRYEIDVLSLGCLGQILSPPYELWGVAHSGGASPRGKCLPPLGKLFNPVEN